MTVGILRLNPRDKHNRQQVVYRTVRWDPIIVEGWHYQKFQILTNSGQLRHVDQSTQLGAMVKDFYKLLEFKIEMFYIIIGTDLSGDLGRDIHMCGIAAIIRKEFSDAVNPYCTALNMMLYSIDFFKPTKYNQSLALEGILKTSYELHCVYIDSVNIFFISNARIQEVVAGFRRVGKFRTTLLGYGTSENCFCNYHSTIFRSYY